MTEPSQPWKPKPRRRGKLWPQLDTTVPTLCFILIFLVFLQAMAVIAGRHHGLQVDLPATANATFKPGAVRDEALLLSVTRNGDVCLRTTKIAVSDLPESIRSELLPGVERRIYIKADGRAKYADVETALDAVAYPSKR